MLEIVLRQTADEVLTASTAWHIAQDLYLLEHQFMAEGGLEGPDYLKFVAEGSGNVANDGMFSIQV